MIDPTANAACGKQATVDEWVHLPGEPCRFCRRPGGVYFLMDDGPEGRDGIEPVRCDLCGRSWTADSSAA